MSEKETAELFLYVELAQLQNAIDALREGLVTKNWKRISDVAVDIQCRGDKLQFYAEQIQYGQ